MKFALPAVILIIVIWVAIAPPRFWINLTHRVDMSDPTASGEALVEKYNCRSCHSIGGEGRNFAPNLSGITRRENPQAIRMWLLTPNKMKANATMPAFRLSDDEITAIQAYLTGLDTASE